MFSEKKNLASLTVTFITTDLTVATSQKMFSEKKSCQLNRHLTVAILTAI